MLPHFLLTVAFNENGNILLVEEGLKTYFFDPQGNYVGVIKDFGAPKKIIFKDGKVKNYVEIQKNKEY